MIATRDRGLPRADILIELLSSGELRTTSAPAGMLIRESDKPIRLEWHDRRSIALAVRIASQIFTEIGQAIEAERRTLADRERR